MLALILSHRAHANALEEQQPPQHAPQPERVECVCGAMDESEEGKHGAVILVFVFV